MRCQSYSGAPEPHLTQLSTRLGLIDPLGFALARPSSSHGRCDLLQPRQSLALADATHGSQCLQLRSPRAHLALLPLVDALARYAYQAPWSFADRPSLRRSRQSAWPACSAPPRCRRYQPSRTESPQRPYSGRGSFASGTCRSTEVRLRGANAPRRLSKFPLPS
jgi:hypothetical protein